MRVDDIEIRLGWACEKDLWEELIALPKYFQRNGVGSVSLSLGMGYPREVVSEHPDRRLRTTQVGSHARRLRDAGVLRLGEADLLISDVENRARVLFCHEGDVHLNTDIEVLADVVRERWIKRGYPVHERLDGKLTRLTEAELKGF